MKSSMAELPDVQDLLTEQEINGSITPNPLPASLWRRMCRASITAVAYLLLYILSQVTVSLRSMSKYSKKLVCYIENADTILI